MASASPKPRFDRRPVKGMIERVASYCMKCKLFVAASDKSEALKVAENAHICKKQARP